MGALFLFNQESQLPEVLFVTLVILSVPLINPLVLENKENSLPYLSFWHTSWFWRSYNHKLWCDECSTISCISCKLNMINKCSFGRLHMYYGHIAVVDCQTLSLQPLHNTSWPFLDLSIPLSSSFQILWSAVLLWLIRLLIIGLFTCLFPSGE